jgi:hypothetical protein
MVAVPLLLLTNVTPAGSAPLSLIAMLAPLGIPVVVTVKEPEAPTLKVVLFALVKAGGLLTTKVVGSVVPETLGSSVKAEDSLVPLPSAS